MVKKRPSTHFATPHACAQRWPRRTGGPAAFTAFVRGLDGDRTPDADLFHDVWHGLRAALAREMRRRGLWQSPPGYLGACGWEHWDSEEGADPRTPGAGSPHTQGGALGELVADCYAFIFVDRLQSLRRHLEDKPDIEGLVLLNVRHFLLERQRQHDPLGFRIFELLQAAVEEAVSTGSLHVLAGDRKIRNDTLLGFDPAAGPPATAPDLSAVVARWNDELMPGLVTAQTRQQVKVVQRLRERLLELPRQGIEAFRFRDVLDPLKRDARGRWAALPPVPAPPGSAVESRLGFEQLTRSVSAAIDRMAASRTRTQLATLWSYLRRRHGEGEGARRAAQDPATLEWTAGCLPSYRQLGERLNIPRERLPALFALLRQLVPR